MAIFRKKSVNERIRKPLAERVQETIKQRESGAATQNTLRDRLQSQLKPKEPQQTPENSRPDADIKGNEPVPAQTTAERAPQTLSATQPESDNFKRFKEICKEQPLAVATVRTLIELLKNHVREPNENRNLLKYLGLDEENLKNLLRAIMIAVIGKNVTRNDIRSLTTRKVTATNILFSKIFKIRNDDDEATMRQHLKKLADVMEPFDELMDYIEKYGNKILNLMSKIGHRIYVEKQSCSVYAQIEWAEELRLPEYNPGKEPRRFDENDIESILSQMSQQVKITRPAIGDALDETATQNPIPATGVNQVAETTNDTEAQRAKQYTDELIRIFKEQPDTEELQQLGLDIDAVFPEDSLGIMLLALKNTPEVDNPEQLMRETFGLENEQEISDKIQEVYRALKDRFDLNNLFQQA